MKDQSTSAQPLKDRGHGERFDSISHELLLRAVRKHTDCPWVLLYIERWLKAPVQLENGTLEPREKGPPQGSVISPLLANLFLHYTFDRWMTKHYPGVPFERFADDALCHCSSEEQAKKLREALEKRFAECGLQLHPEKTKIVYRKDDDRRGNFLHEKFDFLGYGFRARRSKNRWGKFFINFSPGISNAATKAIREEIRGWQLRCRIDRWIDDLARMFNPIIRGWITYYGRYYKSALYPALRYLDQCLAGWAMAKYKRLRRHRRRAAQWVCKTALRDPRLFAIGHCCIMRRLNDKSRMSGDVHVRICERLGVRLPRATRPIVHRRTKAEAEKVRAAIAARLQDCGLKLHPEKTKVVYCKDDDRRRTYPNEKFDFLGYTFRPRRSKSRKGKYFINFSPAVSDKATKTIRKEIRSWNLHLRSDKTIEDLSRMFNPIVRGWLQYYGRFYRSALYPPMRQLDRSLARWAARKYKKLRGHLRRATHWVARISRRDPKLWGHWQMGVRQGSMAGAV